MGFSTFYATVWKQMNNNYGIGPFDCQPTVNIYYGSSFYSVEGDNRTPVSMHHPSFRVLRLKKLEWPVIVLAQNDFRFILPIFQLHQGSSLPSFCPSLHQSRWLHCTKRHFARQVWTWQAPSMRCERILQPG
jgi:hypothetical protein